VGLKRELEMQANIIAKDINTTVMNGSYKTALVKIKMLTPLLEELIKHDG